MRRLLRLLLATAAAGLGVAWAAPDAALSLEDRVSAQRTIEEVFWRHRAWPPENAGPKPALAALLPDEAIRGKVVRGLAESEALARLWGQRIDAEQLRAEVDRMAAGTRDPAMLRELFAALGDDPRRIAECLARPALADRLLRSRYASDAALHGETRRRAEAALAGARGPASLGALDGEHSEITWIDASTEGASPGHERAGEISVDSREEWSRLVARLAGWFGLRPSRGGRRGDPRFAATPAPSALIERLPEGTISPIQETEDGYFVAGILRKGPGSVTIAILGWRKRSFDEWWEEVEAKFSDDALAAGSIAESVPGIAASAGSGAAYGELPVIVAASCSDDQWAAAHPSDLPEERDSHTAIWTGSEMIVWGGAGLAGALNSGGRYTPATDSWTATSISAGTPSPRWNHTAVWTGTEMIVWGGYSGDDDTNTGGRYNPATGSWAPTSTASGVPAIRESHTAVWTGSEMIVWGGDSVLVGFLNTGGRYAPASDTWRPTSNGVSNPSVRSLHAAVWTGREMIVWGGSNDLGFTDTGGRYDPAGDSWTPTSLGAGVPSGRSYPTAVWTGTEMIVWGGSSASGHLNSGARYRVSPESWTPTSTGANAPSARYLHSAVWTGTEMIVWGGFSGTKYSNTGGRYRPSSDTWSPTSVGPAVPATRGYHSAVWTGNEMIVWGGYFYDGSDHVLDTGGRYDPATDAWTPTTAWSDRRRLHSGVWTGAEMIVWGGERLRPPAPAIRLDTGGKYVPATDTWSSTAVDAGTPGPRKYHTAVWTGTEMIVWGGYGGPGVEYATGGRYDPSLDEWAATGTGTGTPTARESHTSVWTGTEMIVWGGWNGVQSFGTGSRYDPSGDTWTAMAAGPQDRYAHTAVWTGSEMIVWGGESFASRPPGTRLASGGRYAPGSDSWTATPLDGGTPAPRCWHTAVWAGDRMIVWGGRDGTAFLGSGGQYVPGAVSFAPVASGAGSPSARAYHTAVWTGAEMIVWGGSQGDASAQQFMATGGRYSPSGDAWRATSTGAGTPSARDGHTAAWAGSEMIVWGGRDAASSLATGGRYCAATCPSPPSGSPGLFVTDDNVTATVSWTAAAGGTGYDLVRGGLVPLRASGGDFTAASVVCLADDTPLLSAADPASPAAGDGFWYLARAVNCGGCGTYDSGAPRQAGSRDAEIDAAPNACP